MTQFKNMLVWCLPATVSAAIIGWSTSASFQITQMEQAAEIGDCPKEILETCTATLTARYPTEIELEGIAACFRLGTETRCSHD